MIIESVVIAPLEDEIAIAVKLLDSCGHIVPYIDIIIRGIYRNTCWRFKLAIASSLAAPLTNDCAVRSELFNSFSGLACHVNVVRAFVNRNSPRFRDRPLSNVRSVFVEKLDSVVAKVSNVD